MAKLNADIPIYECFIRKEYLYDLKHHFNEYVKCTIFGLASITGRALGFDALTENGAQITRLPISALTFKPHPEHISYSVLQLWDCFSYDVSVHKFEYLKEMRVQTVLRNKEVHKGSYMFTVDWYGNNNSEEPGEGGHKNAHVLQLDCGCIAAQPNNRIIWHEPASVVNPVNLQNGERPDYLINTHKWKCEIDPKWVVEDTDKVFYKDKEI